MVNIFGTIYPAVPHISVAAGLQLFCTVYHEQFLRHYSYQNTRRGHRTRQQTELRSERRCRHRKWGCLHAIPVSEIDDRDRELCQGHRENYYLYSNMTRCLTYRT